MLTIGVGGAHSGSGKTALICLLLEALPGFGAIKCTPRPLYTSLVEDPAVLGENQKDTGRYLASGAAEALWVQSTPEDMEETLAIAQARLSHLPGVFIEGNSAIEVSRPDIVIFTFGEPGRFKPGAAAVLAMADLVVPDETGGLPAQPPPRARLVRRDELAGIAEYIRRAVRDG